MKWSTFFQIILLIIILTIALCLIISYNNQNVMSSRYEFYPELTKNSELEIPNKGIVYFPNTYSAVFDKWTGKIYRDDSFCDPAVIIELDYINKTEKVSPLSTEKANIDFNLEKMDKKVQVILEQEDKKNALEALKILKSIK